MPLVVFLKGINVGGHRRFRTTELAKSLQALDVVNIGAAGTFVVRKAVTRDALRAAIAERVPFPIDVMLCDGSDIRRLIADNPFADHTADHEIIPFVSLLASRSKPACAFPFALPGEEDWDLKVLKHDGCFVLGMYRRRMKAIEYLGRLEKLCGTTMSTRNWNTILKIGSVLQRG